MLSLFIRSKSKQERLWDACSYGQEANVKSLIEAGVNLDWKSYVYECYPIHIASQGKPAILRMLLEGGCKVDSLDENDNTALHHAAMSGLTENVAALLSAGAFVDARNNNNWTPLLNAAYWNHPDVTRLLLASGADPFIRNKDGRDALQELCRSKSHDVVGLVDNLNAILDAMEKSGIDEPEVGGISESADIKGILSRGINERCECRNAWDFEADFTPLLFACYHGHLRLVETLLDRGSDINATDQNGWTALHWAAQRCHADIVELLLDRGASRSAKDVRGDMPCNVTNDMGLYECLLPDPEYPNIISNGYVTTDEEDDDPDSEQTHSAAADTPVSLKSADKSSSAVDGASSRAMQSELKELRVLESQVKQLTVAVSNPPIRKETQQSK
ncbi:unnamed protein product [Calicophoron daubneyi]|uniref:Ankyrin repeat protein n=1 Tax=Calicophoron daubneyi TaxID=300641 RepID=A0AAV2TFL9_CALDB